MHYARFEDLRADIVDILERWGYQAHWMVLDTRTQGVPQPRPRFYLVALLRPVAERRFACPLSGSGSPLSMVTLKQTPAFWLPLNSSGPARWTQPWAPA